MQETHTQIRTWPDWLESLGFQRIKRALGRLSGLPSGEHIFVLNTARCSFPLFPERLPLVREEINRSSLDGRQIGSRYNNWALSTIFADYERPLKTVDELLAHIGCNRDLFLQIAQTIHATYKLRGNASDISTWCGMEATQAMPQPYDRRIMGVLKAAGKGQSFPVLRDFGIVSIRPACAGCTAG